MDIFAHGLWTAAAYKAHNVKKPNKKPLNIKWAVFWGILPDLYAFTPSFIAMVFLLATGRMHTADLPRPHESEPPSKLPLYLVAQSLYNISHSAIIFIIIFLAVYAILKRPVWEMGGWFLHILIDIPTHTYQFFPTPVFWPIFGWRFSGISWGEPWFMALNYGAILIVYYFLWRHEKKKA